MSGTHQETASISYEFEVEIEASQEQVWEALSKDIASWWIPDFHMLGADSEVLFETEAGGKLIEKTTSGASLLWYTVQMCQPGESLHLAGFIAPEWGGPATSMLSLKLETQGDSCILRVQDALFGCIKEGTASSLEEGWGMLFKSGLKAHLEAANAK